MRYFVWTVACLAWGLWLGGLCALILFVNVLFIQNRPVGLQAAPLMFGAWERYQFVVSLVAVAAVALGWWLSRARAAALLLAPVVPALLLMLASTLFVTPKMMTMWSEGRSDSPEFRTLHKRSSTLYTAQGLLLIAAGALLPKAVTAGTQHAELHPNAR